MKEEKTTPQDSKAIVAKRISEIMQAQGLMSSALATRCGLPASNLSSMINAKRNPTLETLDRIATALGVPTWQLLTDAAPAPSTDTAANVPSGFSASVESKEKPASGLDYDLLAIDPQTGTARKYRLIDR